MKDKYDAFGFYHDRADPRLFVPKRRRWMGWTINADHRYGRLALAATGALQGGVTIRYLSQEPALDPALDVRGNVEEAVKHQREVLARFDAVMAIMLPTLGEERQATYSPFLPISPKSGRVLQAPTLERNVEKGTIVF